MRALVGTKPGAAQKKGARTPSSCFSRGTAKPRSRNTRQEAAPDWARSRQCSLRELKIRGFLEKRTTALTHYIIIR